MPRPCITRVPMIDFTNPEAVLTVRDAWSGMVGGRSSSHCATFTACGSMSSGALRRAFLRWVRRVEKAFGTPLSWFFVVERPRSGPRHLHALIGGAELVTIRGLRSCWSVKVGISDVRVYDPARGAASYVCKVIPRSDDDYDLSDELPARVP